MAGSDADRWIAARRLAGVAIMATAIALGGAVAQAQTSPADNARAVAPADLTGYWVSVITEDWRVRMLTPPVGEVAGVPVNQEGMKAAQQWQPETDIAAGEQCRPFGAAGIMRMPVRLHVSWQDERTLKVEIDNGQQIRLFHFDAAGEAPASPSWQGVSVAKWETLGQAVGQASIAPVVAGQAQGGGGVTGQAAARAALARQRSPALSGSLQVVTTQMRPGYLRRNGVPYSEHAVLTEFFDRMTASNGDEWLILTSTVNDPKYLSIPYVLTSQFRKESDGSKFNPRPCAITPPTPGPAVPQ